MRYTGPKNRIARREGTDLSLKTVGSKSHARLLKKLNIPPGQHGTRVRRKISEYGFQLREKQKLKYMFGMTDKQLKRYFRTASQKKGNTAFYLAQFLEKRMDNILFRLGLAPTRSAARQLVSHGHVKINKQIVTIPSYQVKKGDQIAFSHEETLKIPFVEKQLTNKDFILPPWLERQGPVGKMKEEPTDGEINKQINLRLIIEFYSR